MISSDMEEIVAEQRPRRRDARRAGHRDPDPRRRARPNRSCSWRSRDARTQPDVDDTKRTQRPPAARRAVRGRRLASPQFLSVANIQNIARLVGMYGIFSIGVGIVIITGGIDLSVGSICALLGVLLSMMLVEWGWPAGVALAAVVALGAVPRGRAWTADHAAAAAAVHRHALRTAPLSRRRAIHRPRFDEGLRHRRGLRVAAGRRVGKRRRRADAVRHHVRGGAPSPWLLVHRSVYGRHLFAVGHNEEASRYSGVNTRARRRLART